ncbi:PIN domain-containing protein [uncultured Clostridium sp.]|uniref:PIN/TRAM domain-containing protein n=1 Tax=uncultured Clostridium sp. TaxID=59620 RepID=UPI00262F36C3|nr:PIN domain-containing protein [uncultured Clostridium sp.]
MLKKLMRGILTLIGLLLGYIIGDAVLKIEAVREISYFSTTLGSVLFLIFISLLFGIILFAISPYIYTLVNNLMDYAEGNMKSVSITEIIYGAIGALVLLIITYFFGKPLSNIYLIGPLLYTLLNIIAALLGMKIMVSKKDDINSMLLSIKKTSKERPLLKEKKEKPVKITKGYKSIPKVLDTSVIIDGRIYDICQTGFIEGPLIIPSFVLDELRHISDSSDSLKRVRGRRGLDILNQIQKEIDIETQIWEGDFPKIAEVDAKLLKLAQTLGGKVITNDYNLNKVAEVQGVPVLNINELSNAIKPVVIPGEEMVVEVVKDGKEQTQGVAYLDDGTMIVVEGGRKHMNKTITVLVTSVLQTAAGRMIFAKPKE